MKFASLGETTIALMGWLTGGTPLGAGGLMAVQVGVAALTLVLRHKLIPPASIVFGSLGSRINGATKLALLRLPASVMPLKMLLPDTPPIVLRLISRCV